MDLFDGFSGTEDGLKNSAFEAIKAELDKQEMKYGEDVSEDGEDHIIRMRQQLDNGSVVSIAIVVTENGDTNDFIKIKYFGLVRLEENSDRTAFIEKLNEWNSAYRYVKFAVDDEQDVVVDIDLPLDLHTGVFQAENFMAMVGVGLQVLEEVYPALMKLRWAKACRGICALPRESKKQIVNQAVRTNTIVRTSCFITYSTFFCMVNLRDFESLFEVALLELVDALHEAFLFPV